MMVQPPQTHNHGNMTTMGKVDTSDLMMIVIRCVTNIFSPSPWLFALPSQQQPYWYGLSWKTGVFFPETECQLPVLYQCYKKKYCIIHCFLKIDHVKVCTKAYPPEYAYSMEYTARNISPISWSLTSSNVSFKCSTWPRKIRDIFSLSTKDNISYVHNRSNTFWRVCIT